jgi:antagonist of KipI
MALIVQKPGIFTSLQDLGRPNYRGLGVNPGGAMDRTSVRALNTILGNEDGSAVLEMHFPAPEIEFTENSTIAIGGANFAPILHKTPVEMWRCIPVEMGSVLTFREPVKGSRSYLAMAGGLKFDRPPGGPTVPLNAGLQIEVGDRARTSYLGQRTRISTDLIPRYSRFPTVRVVAGPEADQLTAKSDEILFRDNFTISPDSDRMGYRLVGERLHLIAQRQMITSGVTFGTIQLLPNGQLIILMADHQTSGGYPRVAQIISVDLPLLAQLGPGDKVAFHLIGIAEAEKLVVQLERDLRLLRTAVMLAR